MRVNAGRRRKRDNKKCCRVFESALIRRKVLKILCNIWYEKEEKTPDIVKEKTMQNFSKKVLTMCLTGDIIIFADAVRKKK